MAFDETIKASTLIAVLESAIKERGDLPVYLKDPDTGWALRLEFDQTGHSLKSNYPDLPDCMSISGDYSLIQEVFL